jgi:hypothetical protein
MCFANYAEILRPISEDTKLTGLLLDCAQPWGALKSRPSLESSFKAIRRRTPRASQMRRRLTALAGATDQRISGEVGIILTPTLKASMTRPPIPIKIIIQNTDIIKIVTAVFNLSFANIN